MKKISFLIIAFVCAVNIYAKDYKAELLMTDGTTISCYTDEPSLKDTEIKIKRTQQGKVEKIASETIKRITLNKGKKDETAVFEYLSYVEYGKEKTDKPVWLEAIYLGEKIIMYKLWERWVSSSSRASYPRYFCRKTNETAATELDDGKQIRLKPFSKIASGYFSDCAKLSAKIANGESGYKERDLDAIVVEYDVQCK